VPLICFTQMEKTGDVTRLWIASVHSEQCSNVCRSDSGVRYADHVESSGVLLFERVCELDLEGIVAKYKFGPYGPDGDALSTWYKIRNRDYSEMVGRNELFERDRHKEPVPGWHACELACADAEN
jgi:hypothetical protein